MFLILNNIKFLKKSTKYNTFFEKEQIKFFFKIKYIYNKIWLMDCFLTKINFLFYFF